MSYTEKEIEEFHKKDIRISRSGIVQALIQSGVFTYDQIIDSGLIKATAEAYLRWVWDEKEPLKAVELPHKMTSTVNWEIIARQVIAPIPDKFETNILNILWDKYMEDCPDDKVVSADLLISQIIKRFNKYPSKESSVSIVMESIPLESLI